MLNALESEALNTFKEQVYNQFADEINKIIMYGSKARGDDNSESDIDILVVTKNDDWKTGDRIRDIGYSLDSEIGYSFSIQVISQSHYDHLQQNGFHFIRNCEKEGILI